MAPARRRLRNLALALAVAVIGAAVYVGYRAFWLPSAASWPRYAFSQKRWSTSPPERRYVLWKDLDQRGLLVGLTRAQVETLLGAPDKDRSEFIVYIVKERNAGEYSLNAWYGVQLNFDSNGRVSRAFVRHD